ncbi:hypothetical protein CORC01_03296 [Colletotrichum orchidophilum]|uniref:Uncharacterized protein n=1 Tax=Colletotrichum orchidophilum TaxID=1209926 RepID=A0A1G4BIZ1_9PEZI|nr:uncharacterized protein CORC01_03296 [Colletotrichum orchidophilum]OHF01263.1 hypothetical protein CORC01_03296 [Colletotrichum orchidophilum]
MILNRFIPISLLASLALASPILKNRDDDNNDNNGTGKALNATEIILAVAPKSASCDGVTTFADECATVDRIAAYLPAAFWKYNVSTTGEMAAVLSLMAFETGEFRYNRNHYPGRPGQGTRNLQMPNYNLMYALSIPELKDKAAEIAGGVADGADLTDDKKNQILDLVIPDDYTWGSAGWFLDTQCDKSVKEELETGTVRGFTLYMECIGTSGTEDRVAYWTKAKAAFGMSS